jgi:hypothetical protein
VGTQETRPLETGAPADAIAPAYYAQGASGWRAWWTLLHPPYTAMHLSFVILGAGLAPELNLRNLTATLLAFFFALGITAHALDELAGRPLGTNIPRPVLVLAAVVGLGVAVAFGVVGLFVVNIHLLWFILVGVFLVLSYSLELFGGLIHTDVWFGLAWGAFPVLTGYFAQDGQITVVALLGAAYALVMAMAQRALSTPARRLRRKVDAVEGQIRYKDGQTIPLNRTLLLDTLERVLRLLVAMSVLVAVAVLATHLAQGTWVSGF